MLSIFSGLFSKAAKPASELKVGDAAPTITALNQDGASTTVDFKNGYTVIYFYPKADTPGCTAQACSLRDSFAELTEQHVQVYGVSTDKPEDQLKFKNKYRLPFTLLSDTDKKIATAFGVPVNFGFTSRQAFLLKDAKIVWLDRSASTKEQAADILKVLSELNGK